MKRLFSRTGDDIAHAFPDVCEALSFEGVIDGELLVMRDGRVGGFGELQQRLNRKTVDAKLMAKYPAGIRAYDILSDGDEDVRSLPFAGRRGRLVHANSLNTWQQDQFLLHGAIYNGR